MSIKTKKNACYLNEDEIKEAWWVDLDMAADEMKDGIAKWKAVIDRWSTELTSKPKVAKELIDADIKDTHEWHIVRAVMKKIIDNDLENGGVLVGSQKGFYAYWDDLVEIVEVFG